MGPAKLLVLLLVVLLGGARILRAQGLGHPSVGDS